MTAAVPFVIDGTVEWLDVSVLTETRIRHHIVLRSTRQLIRACTLHSSGEAMSPMLTRRPTQLACVLATVVSLAAAFPLHGLGAQAKGQGEVVRVKGAKSRGGGADA